MINVLETIQYSQLLRKRCQEFCKMKKVQMQLHKLILAIDGFTARVRLEMASCFAMCLLLLLLLLLLLPERVFRGGLETADLRLQCSSRSPQIWTSERDGPTVGHLAAPH